MVSPQTLIIIGLSMDILGVVILVLPLLKSKEQIEQESGTYIGENRYLRMSMIKDRNKGLLGLGLLIFGFLLQLIARFY